jgi:cell division protein ZapA
MSSPVTVKILGKEYQIACPEEEKAALLASAQMVDKNMEDIRSTGKVVGVDRIAVMAALNIAHELIDSQSGEAQGSYQADLKISQLNDKLNAFLQEDRQLEL